MSKIKKMTTIGGQALIEGIMMKGPDKTAISVRTPSGEIDTDYVYESSVKDKYKILALPVIRGAVTFVESLINGYKALMISADKSGMTDLEEENNAPQNSENNSENSAEDNTENSAENNTETENENNAETAEQPQKENGAEKNGEKDNSVLMGAVMIIGSVLGVVLALFLFMYLPALLFDLLNKLTGNALPNGIRPLFEGVLKIAIFVGYIALVSLEKDIKRVFMYHGAEHKSIFCYEKGLDLTVENVREQSRFHPRCGTSFMILMLVVGIIISFVIVTFFPAITKLRKLWVAIKILLVPFVCGLGYELIRICGRHDNWVTRIISAPGMWVQRLTTKEPEDDMIEVAIASLTAVIPDDPEKDRW